MPKQKGCGKCSLCGSLGTSKTTCPLNPLAKNPDPVKHQLAKKSYKKVKPRVTYVKPTDSKLLQLKGPGSMPKLSNKSAMLTKRIKPSLSKKTFLEGLNIMDRNRVRNRGPQSDRNIIDDINREYETGLQIDLERHREQHRLQDKLEEQKQKTQHESDMRREKARSQRRAQLLSVLEPVKEVDDVDEEPDVDEIRRRRMTRFSKQIGSSKRHRYRL